MEVSVHGGNPVGGLLGELALMLLPQEGSGTDDQQQEDRRQGGQQSPPNGRGEGRDATRKDSPLVGSKVGRLAGFTDHRVPAL